MGVLYGVDVGDGRGVRGTATSYDNYTWYAPEDPSGGDTPQPTLDRLDAFASIVNTYSPFNVRELCDQQTTVSLYGDYGPHFADVFDVGMLYVAELIGAWANGPITFTLTDTVDVSVQVNLAITVDPPITRDERLLPTQYAGFEVPDYLPLGGKPLAVTGFVVNADVKTGIGSMSEIQTFPEPRNINLLARARWLPLDWTIDPFVTYWVPFSGVDPSPCKGLTVEELKDSLTPDGCAMSVQYTVEDFLPGGRFHIRPATDISFDSRPGVNPQFQPRYSYYRDGGYVRNGAMTLRRGRHMWCDEVNWNAEEVTFVMVAVLHEPQAEWCGIIETEAPNLQGLDPFFGIRYHRSGVLNLWADSVLASTPLVSGVVRPTQPVIIGLNIDMSNNTVSMLSADETIKVQQSSLPHRYDNRSRMWLGRSPFGEDATSQIDILEVGYWERRFGQGDLYQLISEYDRIYGVTTS